MYSIDKQFNWEMGHRVWSQNLNSEFSMDSELACRRLHGHSYKVKIGLKADSLKNGMVTDFKHLNFVKTLIDDYLDHKFMIDRNDPLFDAIFDEFREIQQVNKHAISDYFGFFEWVDISKLKYPNYAPEILEHIESFVVVNFVPTSENICKFLYEIIDMKMGEFLASEGIELAFVELWETPKSHCIYRL